VNGRHAPISPRSRSLYNRNLKLPTAFFSPTHAPAKHVAKDWGEGGSPRRRLPSRPPPVTRGGHKSAPGHRRGCVRGASNRLSCSLRVPVPAAGEQQLQLMDSLRCISGRPGSRAEQEPLSGIRQECTLHSTGGCSRRKPGSAKEARSQGGDPNFPLSRPSDLG
jgi:hypothetical protein